MRRRAATVFAALGDETRLRIVNALGRGEPLSTLRLTQGSRKTRQAVTKHLAILARAGVVRSTRRGRERLWTLDPVPLDAAQHDLAAISAQWDAALLRLQRYVERQSP